VEKTSELRLNAPEEGSSGIRFPHTKRSEVAADLVSVSWLNENHLTNRVTMKIVSCIVALTLTL
jgi:hypothetical protein